MEAVSVLNLQSSDSYTFLRDVCRLCGAEAMDTGALFFASSKETHDFSPGTLIHRCFHPRISSVFFEMGISSDRLGERVDHGLPENVCNCCVDRFREIWNFIKTLLHVQIRFLSLSGECEKKLSRDAIDYLSEVTIELENQSGESEQLSEGGFDRPEAPVVEHFSENDRPLTNSRQSPQVNLNVKCEEPNLDVTVVDYKAMHNALNGMDGEPLPGRKSRLSSVKSFLSPSKARVSPSKKDRKRPGVQAEDLLFAEVQTDCTELTEVDDGVNTRFSPESSPSASTAEVDDEFEVQTKRKMKTSVSGRTLTTMQTSAVFDDDNERLLKCVLCEHVTANFRALIRHFKEIHGPSIDVEGKCTDCGFVGRTCVSWRLHVRKRHRSSRGKGVACPACGRRCPDTHALRRHMLMHGGAKDHKCDFCERAFYTDSELRHHRKAKHGAVNEPNGKYRHICEVCGRDFAYRATLLMHMRTHTGEKPFRCSYCNKGFSQKGNLDEHEAIHTGNKPFVCDICAARFIRYSSLDKHMKIHQDQRPYACDMCPIAFKRKDTLTSHKKFCHTDNRPFPCQVCEKAFRVRKDLTVHTRIHTGERPFTCSVCGRGFHVKSNMKKHSKVHQTDSAPLSVPFSPPGLFVRRKKT